MVISLFSTASLVDQLTKDFFSSIKKNGAGFCWNEECKAAFQSLKAYLTSPPLLSKPLPGETLFSILQYQTPQ